VSSFLCGARGLRGKVEPVPGCGAKSAKGDRAHRPEVGAGVAQEEASQLRVALPGISEGYDHLNRRAKTFLREGWRVGCASPICAICLPSFFWASCSCPTLFPPQITT